MTLVIGCWLLAIISGCCWARQYTGLLTGAALLAFVWTHPSVLSSWMGWVQAGALGVTPWLLAVQQEREAARLAQHHADEAVQMAHLSESARTLLSLQASTQQMETHITEITDLYHVTKETSRALHVAELFSASLTIAPRLLNARGLRLIDLSGETAHVLRAVRAADGRMTALPPPTATSGSPEGALLEMELAVIRDVQASGRPASGSAQQLACAFPDGIARVSWTPLWRDQQPAIFQSLRAESDKFRSKEVEGMLKKESLQAVR